MGTEIFSKILLSQPYEITFVNQTIDILHRRILWIGRFVISTKN